MDFYIKVCYVRMIMYWLFIMKSNIYEKNSILFMRNKSYLL